VLAYALYLYLSGFALFLLGFSIFMYFENRKFGDNQFTVKLLPPPPRLSVPEMELRNPAFRSAPAFTRHEMPDELRDEKAAAVFSEAA